MTSPGRCALAIVMCLAVAGCSGLASEPPAPTATRSAAQDGTPRPRRTARPTPVAAATATATPRPAKPTPFPDDIPGLSELLGSDGRLTVLLLGTDKRPDITGERTDAIIVASIDPHTGKVVMASLPRDTVDVPIGQGRVDSERINTLFFELQQQTGKRSTALKRLTSVLSSAFDTEIDYYALVGFEGLRRLVDAIGGVQVRLADPLVDPTMHVSKRGLRLKAGAHRLDGKTALAFSRSRHSDSDYERARRQQQVVAAAAAQVRDRGAAALPALIDLVRGHLETDIPLEAAPALLALAQRADLAHPKSVVLAPSTFAAPGTILYTIKLKIDAVRRMFDRAFGPVD